jgi:hypothetical protein
MEDILNYENRDQLYKFLIDDFGLIKIEEKYDAKVFGNFFITLSAKEFSLRYINNRSYLTIEIASLSDPSKWYDLLFIRNFIYHPDNINSDDRSIDNNTRIEELNSFLRKDFDLISDLFNDDNYADTQQKINESLKEQFKKRFPGMLNE